MRWIRRLRVKAVGRVRDFMLAKFNLLQKPRTNFQILQQSVLLKYKTFMSFLADHGQEVFPEVRAGPARGRGLVRRLVGNCTHADGFIFVHRTLIAFIHDAAV